MLTLTYGRKKPEDNDVGSPVFDALENNITLDDAHTHNGTNSSKLTISSLTRTTQAIASGSWAAAADGTGRYKQTVTIAGGLEFDDIGFMFTNDADDSMLHLDITKASATQYVVYCNDNTLDVTALYL